jgi:inositol transport system ATP-binding protein
MKVIIGICRQDSGHVLIDEKVTDIRNPIEARHHGISMIFQELNYFPEMTVEESLFVGSWPRGRLGKVNWREIRIRAADLLKSEDLPYSLQTQLKALTISDIQMLEIARAVSYNSDVIIMDEPTSAITTNEAETLFAKIGELKRRDKSIIYISHKLDEVFRIADEVTVLRDGCTVDSRPKDSYDPETLITQMVGRKLESVLPEEQREFGDEALRVEGLSRAGRFRDVSFYVRAGEIVGLAGLMGAGRTDVMRAVFGLDRPDSGEIRIRKQKVDIRNVTDSIDKGMVMVSEDRRRYGIIPIRSVRENVSLSNLKRFFFGGRLHAEEEALSGGNQQKVLLARWMLRDPDILLLDEPTRGIDVGAKQEIYRLMRSLAKQKKALIMVSSELPELIMMCDRIYVMAKGRIAGMLKRKEFTQESIMTCATGAMRQNEVST